MGKLKEETARLIQENSAQPYTGANKILSLVCKRIEGARLGKEQISDAKIGHTAIIEPHPSVYEDDYAIAQAQLQAIIDVIKEE